MGSGEQINTSSPGLGFLSWVMRTCDGRAENPPTVAYSVFNFLQGTEQKKKKERPPLPSPELSTNHAPFIGFAKHAGYW